MCRGFSGGHQALVHQDALGEVNERGGGHGRQAKGRDGRGLRGDARPLRQRHRARGPLRAFPGLWRFRGLLHPAGAAPCRSHHGDCRSQRRGRRGRGQRLDAGGGQRGRHRQGPPLPGHRRRGGRDPGPRRPARPRRAARRGRRPGCCQLCDLHGESRVHLEYRRHLQTDAGRLWPVHVQLARRGLHPRHRHGHRQPGERQPALRRHRGDDLGVGLPRRATVRSPRRVSATGAL
mmetsp:Transcript_20893/g.58999  ORF Transcript_20893/g.58999 Transcript_20893/m.58999 type:complete len:234 (+) Transcript_20893:265-966(+)